MPRVGRTILMLVVGVTLAGCGSFWKGPLMDTRDPPPAAHGTSGPEAGIATVEAIDTAGRPVTSVSLSARDKQGRVAWFRVGSLGFGEASAAAPDALDDWRLEAAPWIAKAEELERCHYRGSYRYVCVVPIKSEEP